VIGASEATRTIIEDADCAARSDAKVLITGESGVGKEVVARLVHQRSARSSSPLVTINCAGVPDSLLESELFGHVKGSFTDAYRDKRGWLESANGGTVFMDEVGEMTMRMQAMLLRFLETGEIQRVGSDRRLPPVDVRVITATNRRLYDAIADKTFREDLYYRLNVVHIEIPPLRERCDDILPLMRHFLQRFSQAHRRPMPEVAADAWDALLEYRWPGNVRELKNVAERLVLKARDGSIGLEALPSEILRDRREVPVAMMPTPATSPIHEELFARLTSGSESFWSVVYEPFIARDLTRRTLREIVSLGLWQTRGNYRMLVTLFNMPERDYKRFLHFLRKHQCHVPFQEFRMMRTGVDREPQDARRSA